MRDLKGSDWVQTVSGRPFYLSAPQSEDIILEDIAHSLSMQCRFNGHVRVFYSVAQHSVLVAKCVRERFGNTDVSTLRTALFHDAAEAYIGDMVRPLKVGDEYFQAAEERIERVIAMKFDLIWPHPAVIKRADNALLIAERNKLMRLPPRPWTVREEPWPPYGDLIAWPSDTSRRKFLELAEELT